MPPRQGRQRELCAERREVAPLGAAADPRWSWPAPTPRVRATSSSRPSSSIARTCHKIARHPDHGRRGPLSHIMGGGHLRSRSGTWCSGREHRRRGAPFGWPAPPGAGRLRQHAQHRHGPAGLRPTGRAHHQPRDFAGSSMTPFRPVMMAERISSTSAAPCSCTSPTRLRRGHGRRTASLRRPGPHGLPLVDTAIQLHAPCYSRYPRWLPVIPHPLAAAGDGRRGGTR